MSSEDISRNLYPLRADPQAISYMVLFNSVYKETLKAHLEATGGKVDIGPVSFGILNIMSREALIISYEEQYWLELQSTITSIWNAVQYNEFPLKADVYRCSQCEYFHHCASINNEVSIITHREFQSNDDDIEIVVYKDNPDPKKEEYFQKRLFKLPRKEMKIPQSRPLDAGIKRVVIID